MNPVKIGLLGLGTVGGGTLTVLQRNADEIARRAGRGIVVSHASVRNRSRLEGLAAQDLKRSADPRDVVDDPDIELVVELIGGHEPAFELVMRAIENGKHVVTANKALIALHGNEIFTAAQRRGVMVAFEAAVAGGIPIIKSIREGLAGNHIRWLAGIVNGTGNFILTEMRDHGRDFADVLAEAQRLGYAEADPAMDVDGIDAAHKLTILGSIAFGIPLQYDKVHVEGIDHITRADVAWAEELGFRIKHLGLAFHEEDGYAEFKHRPAEGTQAVDHDQVSNPLREGRSVQSPYDPTEGVANQIDPAIRGFLEITFDKLGQIGDVIHQQVAFPFRSVLRMAMARKIQCENRAKSGKFRCQFYKGQAVVQPTMQH